MVNVTTITHIAGLPITVNGRAIQRCSLCGEKLVDSYGMVAPLEPDGSPPIVGTWEVGRLVRVTVGQNPRGHWVLPPGTELPEDSCLDLVE